MIYAAIVGVAFLVDAPLPPRGVIPAIFLGLAIALATGYVAFLSPEMDEVPWPIEGRDYRSDQVARSEFLVEWISKGVYRRSSAAGFGSSTGLCGGLPPRPVPQARGLRNIR